MRLDKNKQDANESEIPVHLARDDFEHWISYHSGLLDESDIAELREIVNLLVNETNMEG